MKKTIVIMILLTTACNTPKRQIQKNPINESLVKEFKLLFFKGCISKSTANNSVKSFITQDISTAQDFPLKRKSYELINSLTDSIANEIHIDSIKWTSTICSNCQEEAPEVLNRMKTDGLIGKRSIQFCLDYYDSHELDSIARAIIME